MKNIKYFYIRCKTKYRAYRRILIRCHKGISMSTIASVIKNTLPLTFIVKTRSVMTEPNNVTPVTYGTPLH